MRKIVFHPALYAMLFAFCGSAMAQQQTKVAKVGWLSARGASNIGQETIVRMLRDLGYIEGKNAVFEYRFADDKLERLPALADELVRLKVDVVVTPGTPGALALKKATQKIPIVFTDVTNPFAIGLVNSLARPGGNITGFTSVETLLAGKRLELLKETVPKALRVAILWDPQNPSSTQEWKESQSAAQNLGLQLHSMAVRRAGDTSLRSRQASGCLPPRAAPTLPKRAA